MLGDRAQRKNDALTRPLLRVPGARVVDEDPPHLGRDGGEEMRAVLPVGSLFAEQASVDLMDERRRLQRMVGALRSQIVLGNAAHLGVDGLQQSAGRGVVAARAGPRGAR